MSVLIIEVKRNRQSVTQGSATVFINGTAAMTFGDEMYLKNNNGTFTNGFKAATNVRHYGEVIGGWGSITPDSSFILGLLYHPYDLVYHHSDIVRKAILEMDDKLTFNEIEQLRFENSELKEKVTKYENRLQISPSGDDKIDELEEAVENLQYQIKVSNSECRLIDGNAAAVQKEYKAEIERLKADFNRLLSMVRGYCKICKHLECGSLEVPCRNCNKVVKQNYEFKGLE